MQTPEPQPLTPTESWQKLLTWLLEKHYGLALSDTPFHDEALIQEYIDAGVSLVDAVNAWVKRVEIKRIDKPAYGWQPTTPWIGLIDLLNACGSVKL